MKIVHTVTGMGTQSGGTSSCTYELVKGLNEKGLNVQVLCFEPDKNDRLVGDDIIIIKVKKPLENLFLFSLKYKRALNEIIKTDIFHANGLWQYPIMATANIAKKNRKPYVISPHGMLYPEALRKSKLMKEIILKLHLMNDLNQANCIHATCFEEMLHLRNLGIKAPVAIIPNPIDNKAYIDKQISTPDKLRIGYLGRIHPRKNVERLIYAWNKLGDEFKDGELLIIGDGEKTYMQFLKNEVNRLNLKNVKFTGFLRGSDKDIAIKSLSFLAIPSDFENFGMIIAEALMQGVPVITSKGTPWQIVEEYSCGWWIDNDVDTLVYYFKLALKTPEIERLKMGQRGKELVDKYYSTRVVAEKMTSLYKWILSDSKKPEFVDIIDK